MSILSVGAAVEVGFVLAALVAAVSELAAAEAASAIASDASSE